MIQGICVRFCAFQTRISFDESRSDDECQNYSSAKKKVRVCVEIIKIQHPHAFKREQFPPLVMALDILTVFILVIKVIKQRRTLL